MRDSSRDQPGAHDGGSVFRVELRLETPEPGVSIDPIRTYADALAETAVHLQTDCGAVGTCGKCRIRFVSSPPVPSAADAQLLSEHAIQQGWRLACQHVAVDKATLELPAQQSRPQTAEQPVDCDQELQPGIERFSFTLDADGILPVHGCDQTLSDELGQAVLCTRTASDGFRKLAEHSRVRIQGLRRGDRILKLAEDSESLSVLGLAIDVGTTTLAVQLYDLSTGELCATESSYNPQRTYGADVISRIGHVRKLGDAGLEQLQQSVIQGINKLIQTVASTAGIAADDIYRTVVAGNPTMLHLLAGVSPVGIDVSPYTPAFLDSRVHTAAQLGLQGHSEGEVLLLPGISSYIGADIVAGLLATSLGSRNTCELLVDIGTNGEIVLCAEGQLLACSTAAGPAFEGAAIRNGIGAIPGAIDDVELVAGGIRCRTIQGAPAIGICGTGLLAAVHELRIGGWIDESGRLIPQGGSLAPRYGGTGPDARVTLVNGEASIAIYQADIRALQLGKAAIRAGIDTLLAAAGLEPGDLDVVHVAGAFGTFLSPERAIGIGLLPEIAPDRIRAAGNTAAQGAAMVLMNEARLSEANAVAECVDYIELATDAEFTRRFLDRMAFPSEGHELS